MKFHDTHKEFHDRYAVLTVHDPQAKTLADLDGHLKRLQEQKWKREFPFPVILDTTGKTLKAWGIRGFPTIAVIDPEGAVVYKDHGGAEEFLLEQLKNEKQTKERKK
jgi:predicted transcriptional regulator